MRDGGFDHAGDQITHAIPRRQSRTRKRRLPRSVPGGHRSSLADWVRPRSLLGCLPFANRNAGVTGSGCPFHPGSQVADRASPNILGELWHEHESTLQCRLLHFRGRKPLQGRSPTFPILYSHGTQGITKVECRLWILTCPGSKNSSNGARRGTLENDPPIAHRKHPVSLAGGALGLLLGCFGIRARLTVNTASRRWLARTVWP